MANAEILANTNLSACVAILQGHTSLVGQLQMRGNTLVTGGSDGSVRVWSLEKMAPIHRLAAHDNSVTSLQFDDTRVVSGGSDGRVKVWDLKTGVLVRELTAPADAVWRVAFEEEKCVVMASRSNRTIMEVCQSVSVARSLLTLPGVVILSSRRAVIRKGYSRSALALFNPETVKCSRIPIKSERSRPSDVGIALAGSCLLQR